jgi:membrane fusion protein (multidrug efflux system)
MNRKRFLFFMVGIVFLASCHKKKVDQTPPVSVNVYIVKTEKVLYFDQYPANTAAINQVDLRPQVQGVITGIFFKEGTHVRKGQNLYEIDRKLFQESYDQAKDNLEVAKGSLEEAQQDADRYNYLNNYDAVAKQTLDHAVIALRNAKNTVKAAEQALKIADTNLNYSVVRAPFDGTIGFSQVKLGNMVTVGQTVLNTISSDNPMGVDFMISEKQLSRFEDLKRNSNPMDSLFTIILPNDSIYPFEGKISIIDRAVDPQSGTIRVRINFQNPTNILKPGISCVLRVHNQEKKAMMIVPNKSIVELMGEYFVYVVKDSVVPTPNDSIIKKSAMVAIQKKVQTGQILPPDIIILNGIHSGDKIVTDGVQFLHTGSIVSLSQKKHEKSGSRKRAKRV